VPARPAPQAPPAADRLLALQRAAGNRATAQLVQRTIKLNSRATLSLEYYGSEQALDADLAQRYVTWAGRKKIPPGTADAIKAKVKAWILDGAEHTAPGGQYFMSYKAIFDMARAQVAPAPAAAAPQSADLEMPDAVPMSPPIRESEPDDFEDPIPHFRRAASELREFGPDDTDDFSDDERKLRHHKRHGAYDKQVRDRLKAIPYGRRAQDKTGTVPPTTVPYRFGPIERELQGGPSHRMTPKGGGGAPTYAVMVHQLQLAAAPTADAQIAAQVRALLQAGTLPTLPQPAYAVLGELLATIMGPEMSRSSVALASFAAAIHWVAEGKGSLMDAFVGGTAVYLGAGSGGAAALRGEIASLADRDDRAAMERQNERANQAMAEWLAPHVEKGSGEPALNARLKELQVHLLNHAQRFVAALTQMLSPPAVSTPPPDPDLGPDGAPPGDPSVVVL